MTQVYSRYESLVNDPDVDAVYIATPHSLHKANSLLCLQKGIAVLCEKPFAIDAVEVDQMILVAQDNNTLLMEAMWSYFLPHYQFVLIELNNKTYGELLKMEADFGFIKAFDKQSRLFNKSLGGGSLLDIGIYPIFAALSTLGGPDELATSATFFDNGVDSSCSMQFFYENGATASLTSSLLESTSCEALFHCERAIIKIERYFHSPSSVTGMSRKISILNLKLSGITMRLSTLTRYYAKVKKRVNS